MVGDYKTHQKSGPGTAPGCSGAEKPGACEPFGSGPEHRVSPRSGAALFGLSFMENISLSFDVDEAIPAVSAK